MDMRARDLLSKIRNIKGAENAVIAGGAPRDTHLGIEPKDYDFFIPEGGFQSVIELFKEVKKHPDSKQYSKSIHPLSVVYQAEYEGIKVELMRMKLENNEQFGENLMDTFDFGICMTWYEGATLLRQTDKFEKDVSSATMTLYKLDHIEKLPNVMGRFNRLNERLGNKYSFRCPLLRIERSKEQKETVVKDYAYTTYGEDHGFNIRPRIEPLRDIRFVEPRAQPFGIEQAARDLNQAARNENDGQVDAALNRLNQFLRPNPVAEPVRGEWIDPNVQFNPVGEIPLQVDLDEDDDF
jgi:hypothetical protein